MGLSELGYTTNSHSNRENDDSPTDLGVPYFQTNSFFSLDAKKNIIPYLSRFVRLSG
jgi:hypothetical protein